MPQNLVCRCIFSVLLGLLSVFPAHPQVREDVQVLDANRSLSRHLPQGETHKYRITTEAGQYISAHINGMRLDVDARLLGPDGTKIVEIDNALRDDAPLTLSVISVGGDYGLELWLRTKNAIAGDYEVSLSPPRSAQPEDEKRIAAERASETANRLRVEDSADSMARAFVELQTARATWHELGERQAEARALLAQSDVQGGLADNKKRIDLAQEAVELFRQVGDRSGEAAALDEMGLGYAYLSEPLRAREHLERALALYQAAGDPWGQADCLNNLAITYSESADLQQSTEYYSKALPLWRVAGERSSEAYTLNNLAEDYSDLGESEMALEQQLRALTIFRELGNRRGQAFTFYSVGGTYLDLGQPRKAVEAYKQAVKLRRAVGDQRGEAMALNNLGLAYVELGEPHSALERFTESLTLKRELGDQVSQAMTLANIGRAHLALGEPQKALELMEQALPLVKRNRDEVSVLVHLAQTELVLGDLDAARGRIETAIRLTESRRSSVAEQNLRASYFSTVRGRYDLLISILMALDQQRPAHGFAAQALEVSERARARSLLDLLDEKRPDLRQGIDPGLLDRESSLRLLLNEKIADQVRLVSGKHTAQEAESAETEIRKLSADYDKALGEVRAVSPHYTDLVRPQLLMLSEIQHQVLDADTILLEYALCKERSFVWVVTVDSLTAYALPKRTEVEEAARRAYRELSTNNLPAQTAATKALSRMLLQSIAGELGTKRLLIVAEGTLQYIPFGALQDPRGKLLIADHEIVTLPSASTLAVLRREREGRSPAPKTLAVLADPVFDRNDSRVTHAPTGSVNVPATNLERSVKDIGLQHLDRLISSRQEAEAIVALAGESASWKALDFDASRATATSRELRNYRIVHFASHGLLDSRHPELSGIVLSMVDRQGRPQDGFLLAHEVYNLNMNADLVVLSACQTALGKDVRGEGLIGLTRGFMYAAAPRVVASLWRVPDLPTVELMRRFYRAMLLKGQRPAEALRSAQVSMAREGRWTPYHWAGFTLQGEWK